MIQIRRSNIHGYGVFATTNIPANTVIPDNVADSDYELIKPFSDPEWDNSSSCMRPDGMIYIHKLGPGASWTERLNHSDNPNATMTGRRMEVTTLRDIAADEEVTIDYRQHLHPLDRDRLKIETLLSPPLLP